jgi:hypothetical protein
MMPVYVLRDVSVEEEEGAEAEEAEEAEAAGAVKEPSEEAALRGVGVAGAGGVRERGAGEQTRWRAAGRQRVRQGRRQART